MIDLQIQLTTDPYDKEPFHKKQQRATAHSEEERKSTITDVLMNLPLEKVSMLTDILESPVQQPSARSIKHNFRHAIVPYVSTEIAWNYSLVWRLNEAEVLAFDRFNNWTTKPTNKSRLRTLFLK